MRKDAHFVTPECPPLEILEDAQVFRPERNQFVRRGEEKTSESDAAVLSSPSLALSAPEEVKADAGISRFGKFTVCHGMTKRLPS